MRLHFLFTSTFLLFCCVLGQGQNNKIPDTPAGKRLSEMLAIIQTDDQDRVLAFVRSFDPEFGEGFPEEDHLKIFKDVRERTGGLEVTEVKNSEPHDVTVVAKGKKSQKLLLVTIRTAPEAPFPITDIGIRPVERAEPMTQQQPAASPKSISEGTLKRLDEFLVRLQPSGFHGGVLVAQNGEIIFEKGYGFADRARNIPIDKDTVFDIASATKDFTHTAILQLVAQGKLTLDDAITKYFSSVPQDKARITIQNLLDHTAGFPDHSGKDEEVISKEEFWKRIFATKLLSEPGRKESYSNPGYSLLAAIIEKVSGLSYEVYLKESIFDPAGMTQTGYALPNWKPGQIAHTYGDGQDRGSTFDFPHPPDGPYWNLRGNGGTLSTLQDMFKFYEASVKGKLLPDSNLQIFPPNEDLVLAGSDRFHFFLYYRSPQDGLSTIIATTDPAVKAPFVNQQIVKILNGGEGQLP